MDNNLQEAKILIERWRRHFNEVRLHSSLGYKAPAPKTSCLVHDVLNRRHIRTKITFKN